MAEFLGLVKLGTFYHNNSPLSIPKRPWYSGGSPQSLSDRGIGDTYKFEGGMSNWVIGDTSFDEDKKLKWIKIKDGNKILLICDRVILNYINWDTLNQERYITGRKIIIDGQEYLCRVLSGGEDYRNGNSYSGGTPTNNEWDRFIVNEDNIRGLPKPTTSDLDNILNYSDLDGTHNQLWHWWGNCSWCKETYKKDYAYRIIRGDNSARYINNGRKGTRGNFIGWRPVLEVLNSTPCISDGDRNLGNKNTGFNVNYTISDVDNDNLTVTEKLNENILRTLNNAPKGENLTIEITNEMLYRLPLNKTNKISIKVDDGNGGIAYRNYTFTRTNTAPVISDSDRDLGIIDRTIKQTYTAHDEEGNTIIVTEKLDDIILKTFTAEDNREYIIAIPEETWILLKNGQHTLTISATDSNNATSVRTYTFTKKEDRIILELKKPFSTDAKANKILITPVWQNIDKANVKVEVCNNGHDEVKSWEDATKEVLSNNKYTFKNSNKTSEEWGINIKFTIEKKEDVEDEIYFNGFGGAFE